MTLTPHGHKWVLTLLWECWGGWGGMLCQMGNHFIHRTPNGTLWTAIIRIKPLNTSISCQEVRPSTARPVDGLYYAVRERLRAAVLHQADAQVPGAQGRLQHHLSRLQDDGDPKSVAGHHLGMGPVHEHAGGRVHLGGGARQHGLVRSNSSCSIGWSEMSEGGKVRKTFLFFFYVLYPIDFILPCLELYLFTIIQCHVCNICYDRSTSLRCHCIFYWYLIYILIVTLTWHGLFMCQTHNLTY